MRWAGDVVRWGWELACRQGAIGPGDRRGRRFGALGAGSLVAFPVTTLYGERWMRIGRDTIIGPRVTLSAGLPTQVEVNDPAVTIGDRCVIGAGSGIVAHHEIVIGDDVWTGHSIYVTDANHGYEDVDEPIGRQLAPSRPVSIGSGSWLGHGVVVLPGARIGRHVTVGAGSVVVGELPDFSVAVGAPARVIRRWEPGAGWTSAATSPPRR